MRWPNRWRGEVAELLPEIRAVRAQLTDTLAALQAFDARLRETAARDRPEPQRRQVPGD